MEKEAPPVNFVKDKHIEALPDDKWYDYNLLLMIDINREDVSSVKSVARLV